jgi:tRNA-modifying protein YgfZ
MIEPGYHHLRRDVGCVWLPRDVLLVSGPEAVPFLQGQLSQDVEGLAVGSSAPSLVLSPEGKLVALVRATRVADEEVVLDTEGGYGSLVASRLGRFLLRTKAKVSELPWRCLELRGPDATAENGSVVLAASWPGSRGVDLLGESPVAPPGASVVDMDAWEAVRIEAGVPRMGRDLVEGTIPAEAGVVDDTVSFTKGCYVGQELVARIDSRGSRVPRRLCGVVVEAPAVPAVGAELRRRGETKSLGRLTSLSFCPALGSVAGLVYAHRQIEPPSEVELVWEGGTTRGRLAPLPFVGPADRPAGETS